MAPHSLIKKKWVHRAVAELGHFPSYSFCCSENKEVKKKEDPSWGGSKGGEERLNPSPSCTSDAIPGDFLQQALVTDLIKGLAEVHHQGISLVPLVAV